MIDGKNFFDQPVKNDKITYENIRKIAAGHCDDYAAGCLPDYSYFKEIYTMIAIDLSKQQTLDVDPRGIQQINFKVNFDHDGDTIMFFILEEARKLFRTFYKELSKYCKCIVK